MSTSSSTTAVLEEAYATVKDPTTEPYRRVEAATALNAFNVSELNRGMDETAKAITMLAEGFKQMAERTFSLEDLIKDTRERVSALEKQFSELKDRSWRQDESLLSIRNGITEVKRIAKSVEDQQLSTEGRIGILMRDREERLAAAARDRTLAAFTSEEDVAEPWIPVDGAPTDESAKAPETDQ